MDREFIDFSRRLESWYLTRRGTYLAGLERQLLAKELATAFGQNLLLLSPAPVQELCATSPVGRHIFLAAPGQTGVADLRANYADIPLATGSVDVVVLHHALEACSQPHQLLREVQRVIAPQGHLLILTFNPLSLHGLWSLCTRLRPGVTWRQRMITRGRVTDWLSLLGFGLQSVHHDYALSPPNSEWLWQRIVRCNEFLMRRNVPIGGVQIYHAISEVAGVTPLFSGWRPATTQLAGLGVPRPAVSNGSCRSAA